MPKKVILSLLLSVMLVFVSSCGTEKQASAGDDTPAPMPFQPPEAAAPTPADEPSFNGDFIIPDSSVRPVAVMIDNQGDLVLPQGGISQAQIVYEILAEGNITRYMAFFWNTMPEMVGPVRSSRHYFLDYSMEYDAVYTHFGWSEYARKDIKKLKIQNINGLINGDAFWDITKDRKNWQDSYTSRDRIEKQISALKYRTKPDKPFPFRYYEELTVPEKGRKAVDIAIKFISDTNRCSFLYDSDTNMYDRTRMGKPHMERNTEEQVKAANIIILEIASPLIPNDPEGRRNLKDIGTGDGLFITGGVAQPITWAKEARDAQTTYTKENGEKVMLNRGQTWIEIVPDLDMVNVQ